MEKRKMFSSWSVAYGISTASGKSVPITKKIDGKKYYLLSLRLGMTLRDREVIAKELRAWGHSVRLFKDTQRHDVYVR